MPRKPRIHLQEGFYHVMLRGNDGQTIFFDDRDREKFYDLLSEGTFRYGYFVHAFCLMSNHVHLLLQQGVEPLSKPMHNLAFRFTRWVNKHQQRVGHLFQGRYKAILVDKESYLLQLVRYIHLNPIRANIVSSIENYKWSSHQAYLGLRYFPWLSVNFVLSYFSQNLVSARKNYIEFLLRDVADALDKQLNLSLVDSRILGNEKFVKQIISQDQYRILPSKPKYSIEQIVDFAIHEFGVKYETLRGESRNHYHSSIRFTIVWLCHTLGVCSITEIATLLNRDPSTYIRSLRKLTDDKIKNLEILLSNFTE